ncbi:hypothetical protein [Mucilaginibacter paludis]|uniref:Uncharacterized protein n=1 Tax=Mucilaginibacter paludis DSM 18603 TaxID=714943 RepID=H1YA84_9SPHI|nr:hypothetical protein [Mucilaginibacter paludis]EHQ25965.1 hypothetical protein Mucpa_1811 [Mucilaginibacter paludis DSM 18603]
MYITNIKVLGLLFILNAAFLGATAQPLEAKLASTSNMATLSNRQVNRTAPKKGKAITQSAVAGLSIEGHYLARAIEGFDDSCDINADITKVKNVYHYKLYVAGKVHKGILKVSHSNNQGVRYIIFTGIPWALNEGDISQLKDDEEPKSLKLPVGISGSWSNNEIMIQNSGNAMNHYVQLDACDQKYIRMVKQVH